MLSVVCVCVRTVWRKREFVGFWFETTWNPNSSIMTVFSFKLSAAAEDKIKKSWKGREKEKENMKLAKEKEHSKGKGRGSVR